MSSMELSAIIFACIVGSAYLGVFIRSWLPEHHLSSESKDVVKLAMGIIATMTALVLSLLIASAKSSFDTQRIGVAQVAGNVVFLDRTLAIYGPETKEIRELLKSSVIDLIDRTWGTNSRELGGAPPRNGTGEVVYEKILALQPKTDAQRILQNQALKIAAETGQVRWSLFAQQHGSAIPLPFLFILVFWLMLILGSFGLFAPRNTTTMLSLAVCALAVSSAVFLIIEMDRSFTGLIQIPSDPLRSAVDQLGK